LEEKGSERSPEQKQGRETITNSKASQNILCKNARNFQTKKKKNQQVVVVVVVVLVVPINSTIQCNEKKKTRTTTTTNPRNTTHQTQDRKELFLQKLLRARDRTENKNRTTPELPNIDQQ
jgi:hypothetical protein